MTHDELPSGYVLVPVVPTPEMLVAPPNIWPADAKIVWKAMLAAAPAPGTQPDLDELVSRITPQNCHALADSCDAELVALRAVAQAARPALQQLERETGYSEVRRDITEALRAALALLDKP